MSVTRKSSFCLFALVLCLVGLLLASTAEAAAAKKKAAAPPPDNRTLVKQVDPGKQQIVLTFKREKKDVTYTADGNTAITVDGQPGTLKDVKTGMELTGYIERDETSLDSFSVQTATSPPKAKKT